VALALAVLVSVSVSCAFRSRNLDEPDRPAALVRQTLDSLLVAAVDGEAVEGEAQDCRDCFEAWNFDSDWFWNQLVRDDGLKDVLLVLETGTFDEYQGPVHWAHCVYYDGQDNHVLEVYSGRDEASTTRKRISNLRVGDMMTGLVTYFDPESATVVAGYEPNNENCCYFFYMNFFNEEHVRLGLASAVDDQPMLEYIDSILMLPSDVDF
jgi:hypothetical protein